MENSNKEKLRAKLKKKKENRSNAASNAAQASTDDIFGGETDILKMMDLVFSLPSKVV